MGKRGSVSVGSKPENTQRTVGRLLSIIAEHKIAIIVVMVLGLFASLSQVVAPVLQGSVIDEIINSIGKSVDISAILRIIFLLLLLYFVGAVLNFLQSYILSRVTQNVIYKIRRDVQGKLRRLPLNFYDTNSLGDLLSRVTNDVELISSGLLQSVPNLLSMIITLIGAFVVMIITSGRLTLIGLVTIPISMIVSFAIVKVAQKYFRSRQEKLGELGGYIEEAYTGHEIIRASNAEENMVDGFNDINSVLSESEKKSRFMTSLLMPISALFSNLGYVAVVILGGMMIVTGSSPMTIGKLQSFVQLLKMFTQPISQLANMFTELQTALAAAERVFGFLDEEEEPADTTDPIFIENPKGHVKLEHIKFGYSEDNVLIRDLSLKVETNDKVAIVGPTGAGKTTLVNLLMRFYDIQGGSIKIDDVDITDMTREHLRSMFGMVLQDTWLFKGTIMENIRYGNLNATDEQVIEAAKNAYVDDFVRALPDGYNMILQEDGSNISSGQRQLVTIARAFLSDPHILILDEATSQVDTRTEVTIQQAMERLMGNRTSFVIAHRLSTIRDAEMILVLKDGDIVEKGTNDELLALNGFYAELYNNQLLGEEI